MSAQAMIPDLLAAAETMAAMARGHLHTLDLYPEAAEAARGVLVALSDLRAACEQFADRPASDGEVLAAIGPRYEALRTRSDALVALAARLSTVSP